MSGRDITATIQTVELEDIGQGADKSRKLVIGFAGKKKLFVVNKTNANTISKVLGTDETDEWLNRSITIGPREVEFQGNMVWSIRVSLKKPAAAAKPSPADAPESDNDGAGPAVEDEF